MQVQLTTVSPSNYTVAFFTVNRILKQIFTSRNMQTQILVSSHLTEQFGFYFYV